MFLTNNEYEETMNNYIIIKTNCPECKSEHILHDNKHDETFCNNCGLILQDNTLFLITTALQEDHNKERWLRKLHHRRYKLKRE